MRQMVVANPAERPRDMASVCEALREFGPVDTPHAIQYYTVALATGKTNWMEFQLAQARRQALRKNS